MQLMDKEMQTMIMKRMMPALCALIAAVTLCLGMASTAWAAGGESEIRFSQNGSDVGVTLDGKGADVSAFSLVMDVDVNADAEDAVGVGVDFSSYINENTKIHEATFNPVGDKTRITLYVAGGHDLFAQGLSVGQIVLSLDEAKSSGAEVIVEVPYMDESASADEGRADVYALRTVTASRTQTSDPVYQEEPFTAYLGDRQSEEPTNPNDPNNPNNPNDPNNPNNPTNPNNPNDPSDPANPGAGDDQPQMGPDDGYGPQDDPQKRNIRVTGQPNDLSQTGDTLMPIVVTLLCVAALALCAIAFLVISRRKKSR